MRAHVPSVRPQAFQAWQQARGLADAGADVEFLSFAGRGTDGFPIESEAARTGGPPGDEARRSLDAGPDPSVTIGPWRHRTSPAAWGPPLRGVWLRAALLRSRRDMVLLRDPRLVPFIPRSATLLLEWHERPTAATGSMALARPQRHLPVSVGFAAELLAAGVPASRIEVLPNHCGLDRGRAATRVERWTGDGPILTMGLLRRDVLEPLLAVWAADPVLPPWWIVGRDEEGERLRRLQTAIAGEPRLAGRVRLLPPSWGQAREDLLDCCSVWLAPYPAEGDCPHHISPLQVADALGSGLPVVTTDLPSIRRLAGCTSTGGASGLWFSAPDGSRLAADLRAAREGGPRFEAAALPRWVDRARTILQLAEGR